MSITYRRHRHTAVYLCGHPHTGPGVTSTRRIPRPCNVCVERSPEQPLFWARVAEQRTRDVLFCASTAVVVVLACGHFGPPGATAADVCRICHPAPQSRLELERSRCQARGACGVCLALEDEEKERTLQQQADQPTGAAVAVGGPPSPARPKLFLGAAWETSRAAALEEELEEQGRKIVRSAVVAWKCGHYAAEAYDGQALVEKRCEDCRLTKGARARVKEWLMATVEEEEEEEEGEGEVAAG